MIVFRDGVRQDRPVLQGFRCAVPPRMGDHGVRTTSPRPWEAEVEAYFHQLKPPGRRENLIRVGIDENGGVASALAVELISTPGPTDVPLNFGNAVAVSLRLRGRGGGAVDAAVKDAVAQLATRARAAGHSQLVLAGRVHRRNSASQAMARRHGFSPDDGDDDDPYELWSMPVVID